MEDQRITEDVAEKPHRKKPRLSRKGTKGQKEASAVKAKDRNHQLPEAQQSRSSCLVSANSYSRIHRTDRRLSWQVVSKGQSD